MTIQPLNEGRSYGAGPAGLNLIRWIFQGNRVKKSVTMG